MVDGTRRRFLLTLCKSGMRKDAEGKVFLAALGCISFLLSCCGGIIQMSVLVDSLMLRQIPGKSSRFQGCRTVIRGLRLSPCVAARCAARLRFCRLQRLQHTDTLGGGGGSRGGQARKYKEYGEEGANNAEKLD